MSKYQGWKSKKFKMNSKIAHKTKTINPNRTVKITDNLVHLSRFKSKTKLNSNIKSKKSY